MADNLKTIKKKDVKPGMFIQSYGKGTFRDPFVEVGQFVRSFKDIVKYLPDDIENVEILTDKILPPPTGRRKGASRTAKVAAREMAEALPAARRVHDEALNYARKFIDGVRIGKTIEVEDAVPIIGQVIDSISTNEPAALTLAFLKRYDEYTYTHSINVNLYALLLGKALGLDREQLKLLGLAAMFHDVGKGRIPNKVLNKPGKLTDDEFKVMKSHSLQGLKVLSDVEGLDESVLRGVVEHHERYDGKGYPRQLIGVEIHPFARIIAIADVYDALTSVRVYKEAMTPSKTLSLMYKWKDTDFDSDYFNCFIKVMGIYPPGTMVQLTDERFALVLETNEDTPAKPKVKILFSRKMQPVPSECIDLSTCNNNGQSLKVLRQPDPAELGVDMKQLSRFLV
ncbi:HD-GYP domain-containing protein [Maridesulfovibrio hydrothermalis]|uniref:Metal dependent phosphohydrolase n=1 Tax=Maridesulfovibrio hydrothermalis AM13 = DSM 14728 TaxID=1121451 RepID=L0RD63_9BACT|nr:HD-GYP domain-containing protein [Maridesulfovibrio hydrothermalis]CCO23481.1 Metal dependent phosphohydrolase [Maridesulfovibrio hydrothermalis AM13 = DSM 14728]